MHFVNDARFSRGLLLRTVYFILIYPGPCWLLRSHGIGDRFGLTVESSSVSIVREGLF